MTDPKFTYLLSILPFIFGLTLLGDGVHKIIKDEGGWISILFGVLFIGIVIFVQVVAG